MVWEERETWMNATMLGSCAEDVGSRALGQGQTGSMACSKPSALLQHASTLRDEAKMRSFTSRAPFEMYL